MRSYVVRNPGQRISGVIASVRPAIPGSNRSETPGGRRADAFLWGTDRARQSHAHQHAWPSLRPVVRRLRTRTRRDAAPSAARPGAAGLDEVSCAWDLRCKSAPRTVSSSGTRAIEIGRAHV